MSQSLNTDREVRILDDNTRAWHCRLLDDAERWERHAKRYGHEPAIREQSNEIARRCRLAAACFEIKEESNV